MKQGQGLYRLPDAVLGELVKELLPEQGPEQGVYVSQNEPMENLSEAKHRVSPLLQLSYWTKELRTGSPEALGRQSGSQESWRNIQGVFF